MKPTYYGANVRIEHRGSGPGGSLVIQRSNPLSGGWIDVTAFHEYASYCHTHAREYAANLAHKLNLESHIEPHQELVPSIGRSAIVD